MNNSFPKLAWAAQDRPVLIVGGIPVQEKLECIKDYGVSCEWADAHHDAANAIRSLVQRTKSKNCAALVLLHHLLGHKSSKPLVAACRASGVPLAYAGSGGIGEIRSAMIDLEGRMP